MLILGKNICSVMLAKQNCSSMSYHFIQSVLKNSALARKIAFDKYCAIARNVFRKDAQKESRMKEKEDEEEVAQSFEPTADLTTALYYTLYNNCIYTCL